ncbi:hypothetical protein [Shewanella sp. GutDb-MelDb]|jgi:hypothetical protein|uniref:hypothetical protein n=1 Tax=Shewanella sp. GutDb-MelDb TaxID=2058316 RepID=UPI000C7A3887|nr:hypothetical protein [Shewanella sp. GutDb-MelDb]PKG57997.1 hypothetical protein CXF82_06725 [Shewanella sp. GutDb-MelDb]
MKLCNVEPTEVEAISVFVINCFNCADKHYVSLCKTVQEATDAAAKEGWHGYETDDEVCSTACPKCIKEAIQNEAEARV